LVIDAVRDVTSSIQTGTPLAPTPKSTPLTP